GPSVASKLLAIGGPCPMWSRYLSSQSGIAAPIGNPACIGRCAECSFWRGVRCRRDAAALPCAGIDCHARASPQAVPPCRSISARECGGILWLLSHNQHRFVADQPWLCQSRSWLDPGSYG